jgi:hypothetical protein
MIAVSRQAKQFGWRLKFSILWLQIAVGFIGSWLSFEEIHAIERRKQKELHEACLDR